MSCIEPVEALTALDPSSIPASNDYLFLMYGENDTSTAFDFYGKQAEDDYEGHKSTSPPLLNCTLNSLKLEYGGYKTYVTTRNNKVKGDLELQLKSLNAKLICANIQKYKPTREIKVIEREIAEKKGKILAPVTDGLVNSPELPETPEITEIIENFIKVTKDFTKLKDTLTNYVWEKSHFKKQ